MGYLAQEGLCLQSLIKVRVPFSLSVLANVGQDVGIGAAGVFQGVRQESKPHVLLSWARTAGSFHVRNRRMATIFAVTAASISKDTTKDKDILAARTRDDRWQATSRPT